MRRALLELDVQELLGVVPLVKGLGGVQPFVALQAYEVGLEHGGHHLGDLGLAHARVPLDEERHAGVGKTEIAKVMATMLKTNLIRLQCYEGLDASQALYEWNYPKQLLHIKLEESTTHSTSEKEAAIFSPPFLIRRPLLQAISQPGAPPVLLIDEIDRADEEFEAFLLEVLSDFQVTIPEIGTIKATQPPYVILTSNRVRELSDALRRRCLYMWIDFPG